MIDIRSNQQLLSLMVLVTLFFWTAHLHADGTQNEYVLLLNKVDYAAARIDSHATELDALVRRPGSVTWQTHSLEWTQISEQLKEMTGLMDRFRGLAAVEKWQKELGRRIVARIAAMVKNTNDAIALLNQDKTKVEFGTPEYKARVAAVHTFADNIDRLADYGRTRYEIEILETEMGL